MHSAKSLLLVAINGAMQVAAQTPTAPTQTVTTSTTSQTAPSQTTLTSPASRTTVTNATEPLPSYGPACGAAFTSLLPKMEDRPAPDDDIYEIAMSWGKGELYNTQDPCELPSVTGANAAKFSTWASAWNDWSYDHIPESTPHQLYITLIKATRSVFLSIMFKPLGSSPVVRLDVNVV